MKVLIEFDRAVAPALEMDGFEMALRRSVMDPGRNPITYLVGRPFGRVVKGSMVGTDVTCKEASALDECITRLSTLMSSAPTEIGLAIEAERDRLMQVRNNLVADNIG